MAGRPEIWEHCCFNIRGKGLIGSVGVQLGTTSRKTLQQSGAMVPILQYRLSDLFKTSWNIFQC